MNLMKISRTHIVSISFLIICYIAILIYSFTGTLIPEILPEHAANYKFINSLKLFIKFLPAILFTSATIGWALDFGAHASNSRLRFSSAMFERLKIVIINSLFFIFIIEVCIEIFLPQIERKLQNFEDLPSLVIEYQNTAENLYKNQNYELAYKYAKLACGIDDKNQKNKELLFKTESALDEKAKLSKSLVQSMNELTFGKDFLEKPKEKISAPAEPYESYKLLQAARKCRDQEDWFGAHYYAQQSLKISDSLDLNVTECKQLAADAWNKITGAKIFKTTEEQKIFAKKIEGYKALVSEDYLHSYYVFNTLSTSSKALSLDSDVVRYLRISEQALNNQCFYYDETFNLQGYETANNVFFKIKNSINGTTSAYFIRGVASKGTAANMIQYLRGFSIVTLSPNDEYLSGIYVPYAKMKNIETKYIDGEILDNFGLSKKDKNIPMILLNSIDRNLEGINYGPVSVGGFENNRDQGYIILPIPYNEFNLIKDACKGPNSMSLPSLMKFYETANQYGYSSEAYGQSLINRFFYPFYILILFIFAAVTAWNFRINENTIFKFHWIYIFPALCPVIHFILELSKSFFKFMNFSLLGTFGSQYSILMGLVVYGLLILFAGFYFTACRNTNDR